MLDLIERKEVTDDRVEAIRISDLREEEMTRRCIARFQRAMVIIVIVLLVFSSERLVDVVNGFDVGPVQDTAVALAVTWDAQMEKTGMKALDNSIRDHVETLRGLNWGEMHAWKESDSARYSALYLRGMLEDAANIDMVIIDRAVALPLE